jgi:hypothetical protein
VWTYRLKGADQPPYMPQLRALYMAVRETHKGRFKGKGQTVNHMWPLVIGKARARRTLQTMERH